MTLRTIAVPRQSPTGAAFRRAAGAPGFRGSATCKPISFLRALANPAVGDWNSDSGRLRCPGVRADRRQGLSREPAHGFRSAERRSCVVLDGTAAGDTITLTGGGLDRHDQTGTLLVAQNGTEMIDLQRNLRSVADARPSSRRPARSCSTTERPRRLGPKRREELADREGGRACGSRSTGNAVEVVPGSDSLITNQKFADYNLHLEFRTLGTPTNSGVFLEARYEANINEPYGHSTARPTPALTTATVNRRFAPPAAAGLADARYRIPRAKFDATSEKTARATVLFLNGAKIYEDQALGPLAGAAGRLGEAPTGPIMLQEHGMEVQFRNIWAVELK